MLFTYKGLKISKSEDMYWFNTEKVLLIFHTFVLFNFISGTEGRECCPTNTYVMRTSLNCSDGTIPYNLQCPNGVSLLDPSANEYDKFFLSSNGALLMFEGAETPTDRFCLGKFQQNEDNVSQIMVALVCFDDDNGLQAGFVSVIHRLLMLFSVLFLLITLSIYIVLPNLRDLQGKCVIALVSCLLVSYTMLLLIQTFSNYSSDSSCIIQAGTLYFFMSACFFWNNVITFNIWKAVRNITFIVEERVWFAIYLAWGYGVPFLMLVIAFILENIPGDKHLRPHFGETKCWFSGEVESWSFFYGPISILLLANTIMFLQSCWTLWKSYKESNLSRIRSLRFKCMMYLKLFLLMGITWVFEIISFATKENLNSKYLWFFTDCLNASQGIFIFIILVATRQKVRLGLLNKKAFGIKWPQSWANEAAQESSTISYAEDLELAHHNVKILESQK